MIRFRARLYDATLESYIDSSPIEYSIATCINSDKLSQLNMVTDSYTITTIFSLTDFDANAGSNVAERIVSKAIEIHDNTGEWHELRLLTSNSINDYALIWNHVAPSNLTVVQKGIHSNFEYAIPWDTYTGNNDNRHSLAYMFTSAPTIENLNDMALVWMGSYCINNATGNVDTYLSYTEISIAIGNSKYYCYDAGTYFGRNGHGDFYKLYNGSCLIFWRDYSMGTKYKGPVAIVPYVNIHSDVTGTDTRGSAIVGWDGRYTHNTSPYRYRLARGFWWGGYFAYATTGSYDPNDWPVFHIEDTDAEWQAMFETVIDESELSISKRNNELYFYLLGTFEPVIPPSDIDPDNPPDPDEPPDPIPPDDQDPYYDPESDPGNPEYDPTKDPDSPEYDPTQPHTPYRPPSDDDGGDPPVQPPQDPVPVPEIPPAFVTNNAMFTLYNPSASDLNSLAAFLWSPQWSIDTFKKIFANPLDCILGLMVMPHLSAPTSTKEMAVGNIATGVTMRFFTKQFYDFDCGTFKIEEYYASYLDYAPYTKVNIFLPYIGDQQLDTDEVMNKIIGVKYRFDIATGDCVAFISVEGKVLYSYSGNCASRLPLSGNNWSGMLPAFTGALFAAGSMAAGLPALGAASALAVTSMKQNIAHTGSMSGSPGLMGIQKPYLIITRPRQALPLNQNSFTGYPSFMTESLGSLNGYTEVEACHLEHVPCTAEELEEIERLLKEGVLF